MQVGFDRSDQKEPEFTCFCCLSPWVGIKRAAKHLFTISKDPAVDTKRYQDCQTCSLICDVYFGVGWFQPAFAFRLQRGNLRLTKIGGAGRNRTDDILLAKQALSQLSYGPMPFPEEWWARVDSNYRPHAYQACALTT